MHDLAGLLAQKFIARTDVKARQTAKGDYMPVQHCPVCRRSYCSHEEAKVREGWKRSDINAHLAGQVTYGHYLLSPKDECKFFVFDIDLIKEIGSGPDRYRFTSDPAEDPYNDKNEYLGGLVDYYPREVWLNRAHPSRDWLKIQLKLVAHELARKIQDELGLQAAVTYTGAKGMHVYGFTGLIPAKDAREGAQIILDSLAESHLGGVMPHRGENFFRFSNQDPINGQPNVEIEMFPKQGSLDGKDLGNLCRLPLGVNLKNPKDPTFFVDMTTDMMTLKPVDPVWALTTSDVFKVPGE